jgi:hypothetical protein
MVKLMSASGMSSVLPFGSVIVLPAPADETA